ncbi:MAG: hypothetical protein JWL71_2176 [Acidobacteria bacterium]|nr:hypothetical protein [Acidobacteriota bacterium]
MHTRSWPLVLLLLTFVGTAIDAHAEETIVFFRHAEKPSSGLGQITCQGLNRALALPGVLFNLYGRPAYAYASNPAVKIADPGGSFYYVRPLATIEPAAIRAGISVNTGYGYTDVVGLQSVLINSAKANAVVFVAWEHAYLVKIVQSIMTKYGGGTTVPAWVSGDYDSLYVVHVAYTASGTTAWFEHTHEGLNGQPTSCPQ